MRHLSILSLLLASALPAFADTKIAFIAGPKSHASGDHEFNAGCLLLAEKLNAQDDLDIEATVYNSPAWKDDAASREQLAAADAIIIYSDSTKGIAGAWDFFDEYAANGGGLMFMHYAVHPNAEQGERYFRPWIGGAFESGKSVNPHWVADFRVQPDHEVSRGVPEVVNSYDEWYFNIVFPEGEQAQRVRHLGTAIPTPQRIKRVINLWTEAGADMIGSPVTLMWGFEREAGGRGAGFTGGHYHRNWAIDGFRTAVLNTIVWTAGLEVPEGGVKSEPVSEDALNANLDDYGKENPRIPLPNVDDFMALPPDATLEARTVKARAAGQKKGKGKPAAK